MGAQIGHMGGSLMEEIAFNLGLKQSGGMGRRTLWKPYEGISDLKEITQARSYLGFSFTNARANSTKEDTLPDDVSLLFMVIIIHWSNFIMCAKD